MKKIFLGLILISFVVACSSSSSDDDGGVDDNFDRGALLINLADNIIVPAFEDLQTKLTDLNDAKDNFIAEPSQINLDGLRSSWLNAYRSWQYVEMFNIGKAEEILYSFQMNVYPTNITDIESNIASGSYDLTNVNNNDAVGFPALDYMLYGVANDDDSILNKYADEKYKTYLSDLINQMNSLTETVLNDWTSSYRSLFVSSTENTVTSSLNKFVNDFIFYYEKGLRANKFGIPAGVFSNDPLPEKVEGFYNNEVSKELSLIALDAVQTLFNGKSFSSNATGESFNTYLISLERRDLATLINSRLDAANEKIQILNTSYSTQINADNAKMTEAYDALQLAVVSLKVDMLQAFNISVDFVDADGD